MRRGFEKVSGYEYVNLPKRKTKQSAGYDIESAVNVVITPGETKLIPTGLKVYMDENEWLGIYIRSSLAIKYGLILANSVAVIDSDYYNNPDNEGHIMLPIRNVSGMPYTVKKGDRIAQGIFHRYYKVDNDSADGDRTGGIGSTGK
ncbi:dUTP diphosphatase [Dialister invisus]|uniref:dUTP diphosphatase n=1 Tax=Dialister invisus TaxID=218538 RepID=UPI003FD8DF59